MRRKRNEKMEITITVWEGNDFTNYYREYDKPYGESRALLPLVFHPDNILQALVEAAYADLENKTGTDDDEDES